MTKGPLLGFKVYVEDESYRQLTEQEVADGNLYMDQHGDLIRFEPYLDDDGNIVHYVRHPVAMYLVPVYA